MFHEDAEKAAPILNITLTFRNKKASDETKMCGVPHHSIAGPVGKLLSAGLKVAICDQVEPVSQAKGLVKRAVTRILTPGMVYDPESLDQLSAHYLCAFDDDSVSFVDTSTGEAFFYLVGDGGGVERLIRILSPVELVLTPQQREKSFSDKKWEGFHLSVFDKQEDACADSGSASSSSEFSVSEFSGRSANKPESVRVSSGPAQSGIPAQPSAPMKAGEGSAFLPVSAHRLLAYIQEQKGNIKIIRPFQQRVTGQEMGFSSQAQEQMEIFKTYDGDKKNSLFSAVNRVRTPAGARLLKARLRAPSTNIKEIESRLDRVEGWMAQSGKLTQARDMLSRVGDMERKIGKISHPQCNGRDLLSLAHSIRAGLELVPLGESVSVSSGVCSSLRALAKEVFGAIRADAPAGVQAGGIIQKGVSEELDRLINEAEKSQSGLRRMENRERVRTGIPSLKIRYNNVFGFYIEVTKVHSKKVPDDYIRKQTLTQAERYTTMKLQEVEEKVLNTRARRVEMEFRIFESLRQKLMGALPDLFYLSRVVCELDVYTALAYLAIEQSYTRPGFSREGQLVLENSRHPVVEQKQNRHFVPNTVRLKAGECLLLTGPNMAGKSTLMRQVALSAVLAQAGCFVPAERALLPVFTGLFTRIGASDSLSQGLSTFMVEMKESVEILRQADCNCLVILDEIGRGTGTYDGMSLAQAMLEYLIQKKKSLVFFATHYHELTELARVQPAIRNGHLSVSEKDGQINFLYTLKSGALNQSYGVHVAKLAGFPAEVVRRAELLLKQRESSGTGLSSRPATSAPPASAGLPASAVIPAKAGTAPTSTTSAPPASTVIPAKAGTAPTSSTVIPAKAGISSQPPGATGSDLSKKEDEELKMLQALLKEIKTYPLQEKSPLETMNAVANWKKDLTPQK